MNKQRVIILSLQPEPYNKIIGGSKKHEFRRKFLDKAVGAYMNMVLCLRTAFF